MGYTHYWYISLKATDALRERLPAIAEDFKALLPLVPPLAGPLGEGAPAFSAEEIAFNGPAPGDYESFIFPGHYSLPEGGYLFGACKTGPSEEERRPYDLAVQVALILARLHLGEAIRVRSDGHLASWVEAARVVEEGLSLPVDLYWILERRLYRVQDARGRTFYMEARDKASLREGLQHLHQAMGHLARAGFPVPTLEAPYHLVGEERLPQEELPRLREGGKGWVYMP